MEVPTMSSRAEKLLGAPERRHLSVDGFELRAEGDNGLTLTGYASVFDAPYEVYGGPERGGWVETVDREAFDVTLREKPDLHLLINHEGMPLARTKSGTLKLATDQHGLHVEADLDRRDPDVQRLETKMDRGDMDEMSFAFRTIRHEWSEDESERRMLELSLHKGDVSVVNFGANPATSTQLRSLFAALAEGDDEAVRRIREATKNLDDDTTATVRHELAVALRRGTVPNTGLTVSEARALIEAA
jgi:HK97 family phage prohead protease